MLRHQIVQLIQNRQITIIAQKNNKINLPEKVKRCKKDRANAPTTTIVEHSMLQKIFGHKLSKLLSYKHHVVAWSFGGAKTECIEEYSLYKVVWWISKLIVIAFEKMVIACNYYYYKFLSV